MLTRLLISHGNPSRSTNSTEQLLVPSCATGSKSSLPVGARPSNLAHVQAVPITLKSLPPPCALVATCICANLAGVQALSISRALMAAKGQLERWRDEEKRMGNSQENAEGGNDGSILVASWKEELETRVEKEIEVAGGKVEYVQVSVPRNWIVSLHVYTMVCMWLSRGARMLKVAVLAPMRGEFFIFRFWSHVSVCKVHSFPCA